MLSRMRRRENGISTLEVLVSLVLIALVVVFTWRIIGTTLAMLGSGNRGFQKAARVRTQATEWIQAVDEYTRSQGFGVCATAPCTFWIPTSPGPYAQGPALPVTFPCGRIVIDDWDGPTGPVDPATLRLIRIDIYRSITSCSDAGVGTPFLSAQSGIASRQ